jgi:hypothetical protein
LAPKDRYEDRSGDKNYFSEKYGLASGQIKKYIESLRTGQLGEALPAGATK